MDALYLSQVLLLSCFSLTIHILAIFAGAFQKEFVEVRVLSQRFAITLYVLDEKV